jgi:hypothetical protein
MKVNFESINHSGNHKFKKRDKIANKLIKLKIKQAVEKINYIKPDERRNKQTYYFIFFNFLYITV